MLEIRDLSKTFVLHGIDGRRVDALRGVDLDISAGEQVVVAGPSGAGKSSLLKCIYRTYRPTTGSVVLTTDTGSRVDLAQLPDRELADVREGQIGYVSQFLRADPRRSALDVVARAGQRRGMHPGDAREAAADRLRALHIAEDLWSTYPTLLSGGEQQRVNLAAGVIQPPSLLLLDEPVSALDDANREAVYRLIASLQQEGVTTLAVLHDVDAMRRIASRVLRVDGGAIVADGPPDEVLGAADAITYGADA